jgi:hypothetical protein
MESLFPRATSRLAHPQTTRDTLPEVSHIGEAVTFVDGQFANATIRVVVEELQKVRHGTNPV